MPKQSLISKILGRDDPSPTQQIRDAQSELVKRRAEINERLAATEPPGALGGGGPDHQRVLATGSAEELVEMDKERERLQAEHRQLDWQEQRLRERMQEAEREEALQALPGQIDTLPAKIEKYVEAQAAMQAAQSALDEAVDAVTAGRQKIGDDAPTVDHVVVEQIAEIRGMQEPDSPHEFSSARAWLFRRLTGELTPRARGEGAELRGRDRFAEDEHDDAELRLRHPESSIWHRRQPGEPKP